MTRINSAILPASLCDQHLLAEYRELPRVATLAAKATATSLRSIPDRFCLGTGHVKFFLNKGAFLQLRFKAICEELQSRGFNLSFTEYREHPPGLHGNHRPTEEEFNLLAERVTARMPAKPRFTRSTWSEPLHFLPFKYDIHVRTRIEINTDPLRRCYDGCHFSSKLGWTSFQPLEYELPAERVDARLLFWKELNDYAVSQRGESARREFEIHGSNLTPQPA